MKAKRQTEHLGINISKIENMNICYMNVNRKHDIKQDTKHSKPGLLYKLMTRPGPMCSHVYELQWAPGNSVQGGLVNMQQEALGSRVQNP